MGWIIIICIVAILFSFLVLKSADTSATSGYLSPTPITYLNGCLNYQSGVEVKIKADPEVIIIDKYLIPILKISDIQIVKTKQLTEHQKSVIGRAVIGTILAGAIGGIIGGVSGVGTVKKTEDMEILYITYKDDKDIEQTMSFTLKNLAEKSFLLNSWVLGMKGKLHNKNVTTI